MSDSDTDPVDIGAAIDDATKQIFDDETDTTDAEEGSNPDDGSTLGAIDQIGAAIRPALEYAHDVDDEPPVRSGPFPAGGPS